MGQLCEAMRAQPRPAAACCSHQQEPGARRAATPPPLVTLPCPHTMRMQASYLDCISNVQHVGHAHPGVATAVAAQLLALNSNSRFLHSGLADYAEALAGTMPDPLQVGGWAAWGCWLTRCR